MSRTFTTWLLGGLLALAGTAGAQNVPAGESPTTSGTAAAAGEEHARHDHHGKVRKENVRTWTMNVDGREWEVHPATPAYDGTTGLFHMPTAYTLPKGKFAFSIFRDNYDRDPKDIDFSVHGINLAYGVSSKFELYGTAGFQHRVDADALFQPGYYNDLPFVRTGWQTGFGDVKFGGKYKFLDDYRGDAVGLAVRAYVKLGTADEGKGLGTGKTSFGGDIVLSKNVGIADLHGSLGYQINSDPDDRDIANAFKWGVGLNIPACYWLQLQADLTSWNYGDTDSITEQTNPLDLSIGPVVWIKPGWFIRPAVSFNLNFDDRGLNSSSKSWTGRNIAIGFHPGWPCREIEIPPPPPPPPPANRQPTAACEIEKSMVSPGDTVRVRATASDADGDTLTYAWSTSGGTISGTGSEVTLSTTGVTPPATITVTLRVSDGRGGSAESQCSVRMAAPAAPAIPYTCISGGFPRNLARLNNVDKACLDDVASRLRQDPRGRVIVIGHADSTEKTPDVIARKRAEAVKTYLTGERGVEESRITVRSAAATKPADTGKTADARARNRRVEVIFVPEGATVPDQD